MHHDRARQREEENDEAKQGVGAAAHAPGVKRDANQARYRKAPEEARERIGEGVRGHGIRYGFVGGAAGLAVSPFAPPALPCGAPGTLACGAPGSTG